MHAFLISAKIYAICLVLLFPGALLNSDKYNVAAEEPPPELAPPETALASDAPPDVTDDDITLAVMLELASEHPHAFNQVQVTTQEGVVTLTGKAEHLLAKLRAATIVTSFRGVKGVVNRLEVDFEPRPDEDVRREVEAALQAEAATDELAIDVRVRQGIVGLSGEIQSHVQRTLAVQVAQGVHGVRQVEDRLHLRAGEARSDQQIAEDVRSRLKWDAWVDDSAMDVSVQGGVVTLRGAVGSVAERYRAQVNAWVEGAKEVVANELHVQAGMGDRLRREQEALTLSDAEIRRHVQQTIAADPRVKGATIKISVQNGEVTLHGQTSSLAARLAAEEDAQNTVGVGVVINRLAPRPLSDVADDELRHALARVLARDPYLRGQAVSISVQGGEATLSGTVASDFERQRATNLAGSVRGVVAVANELNVLARTDLSDEDLAARIRRRLTWSPYLRGKMFDVTVKQGAATLSGEADSRAQIRLATQIARQAGAVEVTSHIELRRAAQAPQLR